MGGSVDAPFDAPVDVELTQIQGFSGALLDGAGASGGPSNDTLTVLGDTLTVLADAVADDSAGERVLFSFGHAIELPDLPPVPILPALPEFPGV